MKHRVIQNRPRRLGASLIELTVAMGFASVVLGTGIGMLHLLLRTDHTLADSLWRNQTVSKLSKTFRGDVHASKNITIEQPENNPASGVLAIELSQDHRVRYTIDPKRPSLLRQETQGDKVLHNERFRFPPGTSIAFETDDPKLLALVIQSSNPSTKESVEPRTFGPMRELKFEVVRSRDTRWLESRRKDANEKPNPSP